jgi:large subunit ribosomal protein L9
MTKEVLLMADVKDLGDEGDVVHVADGYARNYLLPQQLAAPVTDATRRRLVKIKEEREAKKQAEIQAATTKAGKLSGVSCTITVKAGEDGQLYGSVSAAEVAKALEDQKIEIDKNSIQLDAPIKELGVFDVAVALDHGVEATIKVWVVEE